jgi:DMSO reductase anchor subunit
MIDPVTKAYLPNEIVFKLVMFLLLAVIVYVSAKKLTSTWKENALIFSGINVLLDVIVLIMVFKMPTTEWLYTILPIYIVCFIGGFYLLRNK